MTCSQEASALQLMGCGPSLSLCPHRALEGCVTRCEREQNTQPSVPSGDLCTWIRNEMTP